MKKIITYSAQYKIIPQNITEQPTQNQNQNHTKNTANCIRKNYQKIGKNL